MLLKDRLRCFRLCAGRDSCHTVGEVKFSVPVEGCGQRAATTTEFSNPALVDAKNRAWSAVANFLRSWTGSVSP